MAQPELSAELVSTALRAAEKLGRDVADVPVMAIATATVPALYRVIAHAVSRTPRLALLAFLSNRHGCNTEQLRSRCPD